MYVVHFFYGDSNWDYIQGLKGLDRLIKDNRLKFTKLPEGTVMTDAETTSQFLTKKWIWEQIEEENVSNLLLLFFTIRLTTFSF